MRTLALIVAVWLLSTGLGGRAAEDPPKKLTPEDERAVDAPIRIRHVPEDPSKKLTPGERKQLEAKMREAEAAGIKQYDAGKVAEAAKSLEEALGIARRLYLKEAYPDGYPDLWGNLSELAHVLVVQRRYAEAETLFREVLAMLRRVCKGDHFLLANSLHNLAHVLWVQGKYAEAETFQREVLAMTKRRSKGDDAYLAQTLNNLAFLLQAQGKYADAESLHREALAMCRRLFQGDHPDLATSLNNVAIVLLDQGEYAAAEPLIREALAMRQRLFRGDHPDLATSLNSLAGVLQAQGKYAAAEPLCREALAMRRRLFQGDHPHLAASLNNVASFLADQGKSADAEPLFRDALRMHRALVETYARERAEGEALTFLAMFPGSQHGYLSCVHALRAAPEAVYPEIWASKGAIARVFERRSLACRAAASDPRAAALLAQLTDLRRRRADLILAAVPRDPATRKKREEDLQDLAERIAALDRDLRPLLPSLDRSDRLAKASPADLQKALPSDTVFVDLLAYILNEQDPNVPGERGKKRTWRFLAFVVSRDAIRWVDLGPAKPINEAIALWREAITTPPYAIASDLPARVRDLVWAPLRREFPDGTRVVYLSPDMYLSRVPWAALPGDRPGHLVLEEFAVAVVPHGPFLLDQLWPLDPAPRQAQQVLVAGGVAYGDAPRPADADPTLVAESRSAPALKPGQPLAWGRLPAAEDEARAVAARAARHKLEALVLTGADASADRVLAELPRARLAHLATHGFFADPQFRSALQADPKQFERTLSTTPH
jgi:tetratricopeptide (TPR) repeat protein